MATWVIFGRLISHIARSPGVGRSRAAPSRVAVSRTAISGAHLQANPDAAGHYGRFGGAHYPPELQPALEELASAYDALRSTPEFRAELDSVRKHFQGRPTLVQHLNRDFQAVVGEETRAQLGELTGGALPDHVVACVAGGSNAMGLFAGFLDDAAVALHCVEPLGHPARSASMPRR